MTIESYSWTSYSYKLQPPLTGCGFYLELIDKNLPRTFHRLFTTRAEQDGSDSQDERVPRRMKLGRS